MPDGSRGHPMNQYIYVNGNMSHTTNQSVDALDIYYNLINEYMVQPIIERISLDAPNHIPVVNIVVTDYIVRRTIPRKFMDNAECHDITIFINISNPSESFVFQHTRHLSSIDYDRDHVCYYSESDGPICHCHWTKKQLDEELDLIAQEIAAFHEQH